MVLWSNSTKNLNLVRQIVKVINERLVISKLPRLGESLCVSGWIRGTLYSTIPTELYPQSHTFTRNYTFVFTPGYHETTDSHTSENTHEPTSEHERKYRPACKNEDVKVRKHMQEHTHICTGLHIHTGSIHAPAGKHTCTQACEWWSYTHMRSHACRNAHSGTQECTRRRASILKWGLLYYFIFLYIFHLLYYCLIILILQIVDWCDN